MITLNNCNIDFDIDSSNSILLVTSNLVFMTKKLNRMTILNDGNVGIGIEYPTEPLEVNGNIFASGIIKSTGQGFSGSGALLNNIPLSAIPQIAEEIALLRGGTSETAVGINENIRITSNNLVNRILLETGFGSNYTGRIRSELNTRVDNTSNYVLSASNILVNRILDEDKFSSNYILTSSNNLINKIKENDDNTSNYVLSTSNILVPRIRVEVGFGSNYTLRLNDNQSNYVLSTSNILVSRIREDVGFGSNYTLRLNDNQRDTLIQRKRNVGMPKNGAPTMTSSKLNKYFS